MPQDLIVQRPEGLFCPAGNFHIDPSRPVACAVITHGHGDHARPGMGEYHGSRAGLPILQWRLGQQQYRTYDYGESFAIGNARLSLHPAGHVLGSAQLRIEVDGEVWVASGGFARLPSRGSGRRSTGRAILDDFERATQALARAAGGEQGTDGVDGHTLTPDDAAHVRRADPQFVNRRAVLLDRRHGDLLGLLDKSFDHVFQKRLHGGIKAVLQAAATARFALRRKLATVSLGWAPLLIQ